MNVGIGTVAAQFLSWEYSLTILTIINFLSVPLKSPTNFENAC
jgi:hypothetical protein